MKQKDLLLHIMVHILKPYITQQAMDIQKFGVMFEVIVILI